MVDELAEVAGCVPLVGLIVRDGENGVGSAGEHRTVERPVVTPRVVEAHPHARGPHRRGELADQVATGVVAAFDRVLEGRGPQGVAVMVLGGQHHVPGAGLAADPAQTIEVGRRRLVIEGGDEIVVGEVDTVNVAVVPPSGTSPDLHAVEVPLGVGVLAEHHPRAA